MGTIGKVTAGGSTHLLASTAYGTCATEATTAAKVATIQDSQAFTLLTGVTVHIKFTYTNTVANPTLNVNSTGAKAIMRYGTTRPSTSTVTSWFAGSVISFTYDGTYWQMNDWNQDANTTYSAGNGLALSSNTFSLAFSKYDMLLTYNSTNPENRYGGDWYQVSTGFAYKQAATGATFDSTNTQNGSISWARVGHFVWIRIYWQNKVAISDSTITICTIDASALGLGSTPPLSTQAVGYCDGLNAVMMCALEWASDTGTVYVYDWVTRTTSYPTTTGQGCYVYFMAPLNDACLSPDESMFYLWRKN